jgi:hypothetical protein
VAPKLGEDGLGAELLKFTAKNSLQGWIEYAGYAFVSDKRKEKVPDRYLTIGGWKDMRLKKSSG